MRVFLIIFLLIIAFPSLGQTGAGGVDASSSLELWLKADNLTLSNNDPVSTWTDASGNSYNATQTGSNRPTFITNSINGLPVVRLDGTDDYFDDTHSYSGRTVFTVFNMRTSLQGGDDLGQIWGSYGEGAHVAMDTRSGNQNGFSFDANGSNQGSYGFNGAALIGPFTNNNTSPFTLDQFDILTVEFNGTRAITRQVIGGLHPNFTISQHNLGADIAEIIVYSSTLNAAQRIIVENYLSAKYNLSLSANDYYASSTFTSDLIGIGTTDGAVKHSATASNNAGLHLDENSTSLNAANEYVMAAHNNTSHGTTKDDVAIVGTSRWQRIWYFDKTGTVDAQIAFDFVEAGFSAPSGGSTYRLFYRSGTSGNFTDLGISATVNGNDVEFDVPNANLLDGYYTIGVPNPPIAGPAGVDLTTQNPLFYRSDNVTVTGSNVVSWDDKTSSDNHANAATGTVTLTDNLVNFNPALVFDGTNTLSISGPSGLPTGTSARTFFIVYDEDNTGTENTVAYGTDAAGQRISLTASNGEISVGVNGHRYGDNGFTAGSDYVITSMHIGASANSDAWNMFRNGTTLSPSTLAGSAQAINTGTTAAFIGGNISGTAGYNGGIAEFFAYNTNLDAARRIVIENYLSARYNITVANDFYTANDAAYIHDVAGIGKFGSDKYSASTGNGGGLRLEELSSTLDHATSEFVMAGHSNIPNGSTNDDANFPTYGRWSRIWYVERSENGVVDGGAATVRFTFDFDEAGLTLPSTNPADYDLLRRAGTSGNFTALGLTATVSGNTITFDVVNPSSGYFTLSIPPVARTWYSFKSGNYTDNTVWTLDGAVNPLLVNPDSETPATVDNVVIKPGRTVTMNTNSVTVNSMEVNGVLTIGTSESHNFTSISGNGIIEMSGAASDDGDNFPSGTVTAFADASNGGTVKITGNGMTLDVARTFNNVIVDLDLNSPKYEAVMMADYTIAGNLTVQNGIFQINDNSSTTNLNIAVTGNVTVRGDASNTGEINVGTGNARHQFNFQGDLLNNQGTIEFTNRVSQDPNSDATNGIVDANFLNDSKDQSITCNGTTTFYRIEIDKGTDDTYILNIDANSAANFNLFGRANYGHNSIAQLDDGNASAGDRNLNALGLYRGTVRLGTNVTVNPLNNTGNYNISAAAQIWVDGGSTTKAAGTAIVPYGVARITDGTFNATVNSGFTLRENATVQVEGGTLTANQIRTSVLGASNVGGWIQSGGTARITGGSTNTDWYVFTLTFAGNVFNMSGGSLIIEEGNAKGALFINCDAENQTVTGGTIEIGVDNSNNSVITTRAPFWNLTLRDTGGSGNVTLDQGVDVGSTDVDLAAQPISILNDFSVEANTTFVTNNQNVNVSGDFAVASGGVVTLGTNTFTFDGNKDSDISINTGSTFNFNDLTISKDQGQETFIIQAGQTNALQVDGAFRVENGNVDYNTFNIVARTSVYVADTIGPEASTGRLLLNGPAAQTITSSNGNIGSMELNNANGITLSSDSLTMTNTLTMTSGVFNIATERLTLGTATANIAGSGFGTSKMIQTAGNASDGGLSMFVDANETITYPVGTNANATVRYTPITATFSNVTASGNVAISMGDAELQTVVLPTSSDLLTYNWRVRHYNFSALPNVTSYVFTTVDSDDPDGGATPSGLPGTFLPGKVLDELPFTRSSEIAANITNFAITFNGNTGGGATPFTLENANYTAGVSARFVGAPTIYYSRRHQIGGGGLTWTDLDDWSTDAVLKHGGAAAASFPGVGDIVVIGAGQINGSDEANDTGLTSTTARHQMVAQASRTVAEVIFDSNPAGTAIGNNLSRIRLSNTGWTLTAGRISGLGEIMTAISTSAEATVVGDLGDFNKTPNSTFFLDLTTSGTATVSRTEYPGIRIYARNAPGKIITFSGDVTGQQMLIDGQATLDVNSNITLDGNLQIGNNQHGLITFPGSASNYTVTLGGDLLTSNDDTSNSLSVANSGSAEHTLSVGGNINLRAMSTFDLSAASTVILELKEAGTHTFMNTSAANPDLHRIVMNKGTSLASTFTFLDDFTLNGTTNTATKAITIQKGILILNDPNISVNLTTGGGDFTIPEHSGLEIQQGVAYVSGDDTGIILDGLLRVSGGTLNMDISDVNNPGNGMGENGNNYIEYSATGTATLNVTNGTLTVGSQVRRNLTAANGVLTYDQSGGTVVIGKNAAPEASRGVFEIANAGSTFNLSNIAEDQFVIVRQNGTTPTIAALFLEPASSTITNSSVTLGSTDTPVGQNSFGINSNTTIDDLILKGSNSPTFTMQVNALTVGNLTINASNTLDANGRTLTVNESMTNNGTFTPNSNTTIFNTSSTQSISGSGSTTFYNMTKQGASSLSLSNNISVSNDLTISAGTLATGSNNLTLLGDMVHDGTHSSTSGSGIIFGGSSLQQISRSSSGTSDFGIITINNSNGVRIVDGNGYNFDINTNLRLQSGVLNIGGSLLTIAASGTITEVTAASVTNMIQTNSSFTDNGLKREFNAIASSTVIKFPVGETKYTPVTFTVSSSDAGNITVRPANEKHPSVIEDAEAPDTEIVDASNALQYHWVIRAENFTNFNGSSVIQFDPADLLVTAPYTSANYIAARLLLNSTNWDKAFNQEDFDEAANEINFTFTSAGTTAVAGEYTAGVGVNNLGAEINGAIPDQVPTYETTGGGNFSDPNIWTPTPPGTIVGAVVTVKAGHTMTLDVDGTRVLRTVIEDGGTLEINGTENHRLGDVSGSGTIRIVSNDNNANLPTGFYTDFFTCPSGGGLEYAGSGNYDVLSGIPTLRNLTLSGTGTKTLANNDIVICNDLTVSGGNTFNNTFNRNITVQNDIVLSSGTFNSGEGNNVSVTNDVTVSGGTFNGEGSGTTSIGGNLTVSSGTFNAGSGGEIQVAGNVTYTSGTFDGGSGTSKIVMNGSTGQTVNGTFTGAADFHRLEINNTSASGVTFTGNAYVDNELLLTDGILYPGSNTFTLSTTATATPATGSSQSYVSRKLYKEMNISSSFTFPVGDLVRWGFASVNNVSMGGMTWSVEYIAEDPRNDALVDNITPASPATIKTISGNEHWKISDGVGGPSGATATIGLRWDNDSDVSTEVAERETMQVMVWNDTNTNWDHYGGGTFSSGHTQASGNFMATSTISFSEQIITIGSNDDANPLPVQLIAFDGEIEDDEVILEWTTAQEVNNDYFEIQRSVNGKDFETIGTEEGMGNTTVITNYSFTDENPFPGTIYYRLKQVDFDENFEYSEVISVEYSSLIKKLDVNLFPNPTNANNVNVRIISENSDKPVYFRINDISGVIYHEQKIGIEAFAQDYNIKSQKRLPAGMYLVTIIQGKNIVTKRLVIK